ncbi:hypothetical protein M8J75_010601 [Diaphorina citri]|nr:hypothetical protein M8J75_010601 [Diaphorina citri]
MNFFSTARIKTQPYRTLGTNNFIHWPWHVLRVPLPPTTAVYAPTFGPTPNTDNSIDFTTTASQDTKLYQTSYKYPKRKTDRRVNPMVCKVDAKELRTHGFSIENLQKSYKQIKESPPPSPPSDAIDYSMKVSPARSPGPRYTTPEEWSHSTMVN